VGEDRGVGAGTEMDTEVVIVFAAGVDVGTNIVIEEVFACCRTLMSV